MGQTVVKQAWLLWGWYALSWNNDREKDEHPTVTSENWVWSSATLRCLPRLQHPAQAFLAFSLQCCHSLNKWLNKFSPHSTHKSVKQPHRDLTTVGTSPISDTNSLTTEHCISGVLRCRQCCSNTVQGLASPSHHGIISAHVGEVSRAAAYLCTIASWEKTEEQRDRLCCCDCCACTVGRGFLFSQRCCAKDR